MNTLFPFTPKGISFCIMKIKIYIISIKRTIFWAEDRLHLLLTEKINKLLENSKHDNTYHKTTYAIWWERNKTRNRVRKSLKIFFISKYLQIIP